MILISKNSLATPKAMITKEDGKVVRKQKNITTLWHMDWLKKMQRLKSELKDSSLSLY